MRTGLGDPAVRIVLVLAVTATAVATHWYHIDRTRQTPRELVLSRMPGTGSEMARAVEWLDRYYASPEGLQRPAGLWSEGHLDYEAIGVWLFDWYLRARLSGADEEQARKVVLQGIQQSAEWRDKHPESTPSR